MLIDNVVKMMPEMTPVNRKIAKYLIDNPQEFGLSTVEEIAERLEISRASLVRFARLLAFKGFYDLKKAIQEDIRERLNPYEKIKNTKLDAMTQENQFDFFTSIELKNIKSTLSTIQTEDILNFLAAVKESENIFVSGFGLSKHLAMALVFSLNNLLTKPVTLLNGSLDDFVYLMTHISDKSCIIHYSFPAYSSESNFVYEEAKKRKAKQILFTDSKSCPLYAGCVASFICKNDSVLLTNSLVQPTLITQTLMHMLILTDKEKMENHLTAIYNSEIEARKNIKESD
ncbi:MAG TPA: MurR/RpiR family transcriptional regulator [Thermotogota bacterium]|nr:MurR/RpiR family transcriptional regulator [Thermotogota bacterium]HPJ88772.1 MurR/RpiR family transcriptional regulator [Thermotogota bacterium]HPR96275.1 MurR/RpiR family transcriptional regulator [Thermotogota bacterium]